MTQGRQKGWVHVPSGAELLAREDKYGDSIRDWLQANFPDLCCPDPHPAAVAAVVRLHYLHGKGKLTAKGHGDEIRGFVATWRERMGEDAEVAA